MGKLTKTGLVPPTILTDIVLQTRLVCKGLKSYYCSFVGGSGLSESKLQDCLHRARSRTKEVCSLIEDTINALDR